MRVTRIQFDDSEPSESVAGRISVAFDPGNILKIRDKFFKMSSNRSINPTSESNVVGDRYTLILRPGEPIPAGLVVAPPPVPKLIPESNQQKEPEEAPSQERGSIPPPEASEVFSSPSLDKPVDHSVANQTQVDKPKSGEYRLELPPQESIEAAPTSVEVGPGQVWQSKDSRRQSAPFTITNVDQEFAYQDNGRKIALNRMSRYRRVS
jgi:hypothetical protein